MNTEETTPTATVTESWRVVIKCTFLAPTYHRGSRIKVARWDSATYSKDPNGITVSWNDALNTGANYAEAVRQYLLKAGWDGQWVVSTCPIGAVATYTPEA